MALALAMYDRAYAHIADRLVKARLIDRRKKSGTFVAYPQAQSAVLEIHDIRQEVQSLNLAYRYELITRVRRKARAEDMQRLGLAKPTDVLDLACLHYAGDFPFCLERRLIDLSVVPEASGFDFKTLVPAAT